MDHLVAHPPGKFLLACLALLSGAAECLNYLLIAWISAVKIKKYV